MRTYRGQKAALARAITSGDPSRVVAECERTVREWGACAWPDDWHRWNIAYGDATAELAGHWSGRRELHTIGM